MTSYEYKLDEKAEVAVRFISHVRSELQRAFASEKSSRKMTQQQIATKL